MFSADGIYWGWNEKWNSKYVCRVNKKNFIHRFMQKQNYDSYTLDFIVKASCSYLCESWKKSNMKLQCEKIKFQWIFGFWGDVWINANNSYRKKPIRPSSISRGSEGHPWSSTDSSGYGTDCSTKSKGIPKANSFGGVPHSQHIKTASKSQSLCKAGQLHSNNKTNITKVK